MTDELILREEIKPVQLPKPEPQKPRKVRRGLLASVMLGLILIWTGVVYLAYATGYLEQYLGEQQPVRIDDFWILPVPWGIILLGVALILLLDVVLRAIIPAFRRGLLASLVFAAILFNLALGEAFPWEMVIPVVLIAIGGMILIRALFGNRKKA